VMVSELQARRSVSAASLCRHSDWCLLTSPAPEKRSRGRSRCHMRRCRPWWSVGHKGHRRPTWQSESKRTLRARVSSVALQGGASPQLHLLQRHPPAT
jgi:hypothetical protein